MRGRLAWFEANPASEPSRPSTSAEVQRMVQILLSLPKPPTPDHAADALAVAICHVLASPLLKASTR